MPNGSILPVFISLGLFIAAFGAMYHGDEGNTWGIPVLIIGLAIALGSMLIRSLKDDHGFHIHKEELIEDDNDKGLRRKCMLKRSLHQKHTSKHLKRQPRREEQIFRFLVIPWRRNGVIRLPICNIYCFKG